MRKKENVLLGGCGFIQKIVSTCGWVSKTTDDVNQSEGWS